jgi:hypothetical protein
MKRAALLAIVAGVAVAQQTSPTGFGRALYPGTGGPTAPLRGSFGGVTSGNQGSGFGRMIYPGTGAPALMRGGGVFAPPPAIGHGAHSRGVLVPYPVFYGGGYYDSFQAPPAATPASEYDLNYPAQRAPVVIINQNFRPDVVNPDDSYAPPPQAAYTRDRAPDAPPPAARIANNDRDDDEATIYLIVLQDHTIFAAVAYWVEGDTLNYVTREGNHNRVTLDLVDRDLSYRLNGERRVDFKLPRR